MANHSEYPNRDDDGLVVEPDLLDVLVQRAFLTGLDLHSVLAMAGDQRLSDRLQDAIDRVDDIVSGLREVALALDTQIPGGLQDAWRSFERTVDRSTPSARNRALARDAALPGVGEDALRGAGSWFGQVLALQRGERFTGP